MRDDVIDFKVRNILKDLKAKVSEVTNIPDVYRDETVKDTINDLNNAFKESL